MYYISTKILIRRETVEPQFLGDFTKLRKAIINFIMSVRPSLWNNSGPTGRIFMKFVIWVFFENLSRKFKLYQNLTKITGTLHEDQNTFLIISRSFLLRMRNVSDKSCRENQNTHFVFCKFFFSENRALYDMTWRIILERGRPQMTIWRMRIACWITKATNTHLEYAILIAFPLQQYQILPLS